MIPAEVSLVISNPGVSPIQLQEGLLLGAAKPAAWLRNFTEPVGTTCEKDVRVHPEMPTQAALRPPVDREPFALDDKSLAIDRMSEEWQSANEQITKAQKRQKGQHDHHARSATFKSGDRVFVYMPGSRTDKAYKLSRPYHGPYCVVTALDCGVDVRPVDKLNATPIRVALNRIRPCPAEIPDTFWPQKTPPHAKTFGKVAENTPETKWTSRLRPRPSPRTGSS